MKWWQKMPESTDFERGFAAAYAIIFPTLAQAYKDNARLEAEVKRLEASLELSRRQQIDEAMRKTREVFNAARKEVFDAERKEAGK